MSGIQGYNRLINQYEMFDKSLNKESNVKPVRVDKVAKEILLQPARNVQPDFVIIQQASNPATFRKDLDDIQKMITDPKVSGVDLLKLAEKMKSVLTTVCVIAPPGSDVSKELAQQLLRLHETNLKIIKEKFDSYEHLTDEVDNKEGLTFDNLDKQTAKILSEFNNDMKLYRNLISPEYEQALYRTLENLGTLDTFQPNSPPTDLDKAYSTTLQDFKNRLATPRSKPSPPPLPPLPFAPPLPPKPHLHPPALPIRPPPIPVRPPPIPSKHQLMHQALREDLNNRTAFEALSGKAQGTFLIRNSGSTPGGKVLHYVDKGTIQTYTLNPKEGQKGYQLAWINSAREAEDEGAVIENLEDLFEYPLLNGAKLTIPLAKPGEVPPPMPPPLPNVSSDEKILPPIPRTVPPPTPKRTLKPEQQKQMMTVIQKVTSFIPTGYNPATDTTLTPEERNLINKIIDLSKASSAAVVQSYGVKPGAPPPPEYFLDQLVDVRQFLILMQKKTTHDQLTTKDINKKLDVLNELNKELHLSNISFSSSEPLEAKTRASIQKLNFNLLQLLETQPGKMQSGEGTCITGIGVCGVLGLLGAFITDPNKKTEFLSHLGLYDKTKEQGLSPQQKEAICQAVDNAFNATLDELTNFTGPNGKIAVTQTVASRSDVDSKIISNLREKFHATFVEKLSNDPTIAANTLNQIVKKATGDAIPSLFSEISQSVDKVLVNTVSFQGAWTTPFDPDKNRLIDFTCANGNTVPKKFMCDKRDVDFYQQAPSLEMPGFKIIALNYISPEGKALKSVKILPANAEDLPMLLDRFAKEPDYVQKCLRKAEHKEVDIMIPKLKISKRADITEPLRTMTGLPKLPQTIQQVELIEDEKGTSMEAATAMFTPKGLGTDFHATHSHITMITDEHDTPLMVATIKDESMLGEKE